MNYSPNTTWVGVEIIWILWNIVFQQYLFFSTFIFSARVKKIHFLGDFTEVHPRKKFKLELAVNNFRSSKVKDKTALFHYFKQYLKRLKQMFGSKVLIYYHFPVKCTTYKSNCKFSFAWQHFCVLHYIFWSFTAKRKPNRTLSQTASIEIIKYLRHYLSAYYAIYCNYIYIYLKFVNFNGNH